MSAYVLLAFLPLAWALYSIVSFISNYHRVRQLDIPKVLTPICPSNVVWVITQSLILPILDRLPFGVGESMRYSRWGWEFLDKHQSHTKMGDIWMQITPANNWIYVANPEAVVEIFNRRHEFRRPLQLYSMLDIFGANVATTEGSAWQIQRKITATPFNEYNNNRVWVESLHQSKDMLQWWLSHRTTGVRSTAKDTRALSLNILAYVGFGRSYPFDGAFSMSETSYAVSFRDSLSVVLDNALLTLAIPPSILRLPIFPKSWSRVGWAIKTLKEHMMTWFLDEQSRFSQGKKGTGTLMSSMVDASETITCDPAHTSPKDKSGQLQHRKEGITVDEIFGNIFVYYFAGHDTTASVFTYAVLLLAANRECQDWIAEELQHVLPTEDNEAWGYESTFPRLKRCLAVLLETIRLYDPIPGLPKWTGEGERLLQVGDQSLVIPPRTMVLPSLMALHTLPGYWGEDSLVWRPSRWIIPTPSLESEGPVDLGTQLEKESILVPVKGTYFPWSEGQRNCPGKKFAQVEFVAVMANLFRDHCAQPIPMPGENQDHARQRLFNVVNDSQLRLLLQVRDPSSVPISWARR